MKFNKYSKLYLGIVLKAQDREEDPNEYYEEHHALPKCLYPEFKKLKEFPWNRVRLTAREHYLCHWLLTKCFTDTVSTRKMEWAFHRIAFSKTSKTNRRLTSAQYQLARKIHAKNMATNHPKYRGDWAEKVSVSNKLAWQDEERRKKTSERMKQTWAEKREYMLARARENSAKAAEAYWARKEDQ